MQSMLHYFERTVVICVADMFIVYIYVYKHIKFIFAHT